MLRLHGDLSEEVAAGSTVPKVRNFVGVGGRVGREAVLGEDALMAARVVERSCGPRLLDVEDVRVAARRQFLPPVADPRWAPEVAQVRALRDAVEAKRWEVRAERRSRGQVVA